MAGTGSGWLIGLALLATEPDPNRAPSAELLEFLAEFEDAGVFIDPPPADAGPDAEPRDGPAEDDDEPR